MSLVALQRIFILAIFIVPKVTGGLTLLQLTYV